MPYRSNTDLPLPVQAHLPSPAQTIYREAFNRAWQSYRENPRQEEIAHRVAWAAVKRRYRKLGSLWVPKREPTLLGARSAGDRR
jgi:cation transport regulator